jgi:hypothetical protein
LTQSKQLRKYRKHRRQASAWERLPKARKDMSLPKAKAQEVGMKTKDIPKMDMDVVGMAKLSTKMAPETGHNWA